MFYQSISRISFPPTSPFSNSVWASAISFSFITRLYNGVMPWSLMSWKRSWITDSVGWLL